MPALVAGIHAFSEFNVAKAWMATERGLARVLKCKNTQVG
jgi:hypothetical protein